MLHFSIRRVVVALSLVAASALAGCGGNSNSSSNLPTVTGACAAPSGVQVALVYPAPGSTAIGTSITQVVIAASGPLPASFDAALIFPNSTTPLYGGSITQVQPPFAQPYTLTPFANPIYYLSTISTVPQPSSSPVTVAINDLNSPCVPTGISTYSQ